VSRVFGGRARPRIRWCERLPGTGRWCREVALGSHGPTGTARLPGNRTEHSRRRITTSGGATLRVVSAGLDPATILDALPQVTQSRLEELVKQAQDVTRGPGWIDGVEAVAP
jgi:hypothetical protein